MSHVYFVPKEISVRDFLRLINCETATTKGVTLSGVEGGFSMFVEDKLPPHWIKEMGLKYVGNDSGSGANKLVGWIKKFYRR